MDRPATQPDACPYPALDPPLRIPLVTLAEHACPYLPARLAEARAFIARRLPGELYHRFMDANFRRSGELFYQPACRGCRRCMQIRVPADRFRPRRSQRRCWRRNQDLAVNVEPNHGTDEKFSLYCEYQRQRHHADEERERSAFDSFLSTSPVDSLDICYRDAAGRLLAVGVCDVCRHSLSSVYFYFDPREARRSLGTFGVLWEIELARQKGIPYYYIGYWIKGCPRMEYKAAFRPCELLQADGTWQTLS